MPKQVPRINVHIYALTEPDYFRMRERHAALRFGTPDVHAMLKAHDVPSVLIDDLAFALGVDGACRLAALWYAQDIGALLDTGGETHGD